MGETRSHGAVIGFVSAQCVSARSNSSLVVSSIFSPLIKIDSNQGDEPERGTDAQCPDEHGEDKHRHQSSGGSWVYTWISRLISDNGLPVDKITFASAIPETVSRLIALAYPIKSGPVIRITYPATPGHASTL